MLLFLHGFLGAPSDWDPVISHLPSHSCRALELPGHGSTPFTPHFLDTIPRFDAPIHLIGYSMGGRLAMHYATRFPERVASLTLASCHTGLTSEEERNKRREQDQFWALELRRSNLDEFLKRWYDQPIFGHFQPDLTMRRKHNPEALAQCLLHYSLANQPVFSPREALVIVGERDLKYRTLFPNAKIIPHAAHMVHLENPSAFATLIQQRILL